MKQLLRNGFVGVGTPAAGITVSLLPQLEQWLRIVSLTTGIAVGVVTFVCLLKRLKNGK